METKKLVRLFIVPSIIVVALILFAYVHYYLQNETLATTIAITAIILGSLKLITDTFTSIIKGEFALDYIALLAITTGVATGNYLVALVIVLMLSGGNTLEEYGTARAQKSLTALINRIPNKALLWANNTRNSYNRQSLRTK
jgi:cation transport ATPase